MLPPLVKLKVEDPDLLRVQDRIYTSLQAALRVPLLDGNLVTQTFSAGVATPVNHGLGRKPVGYLVVSNSSGAAVAETDKTQRTAGTLTITTSANVTLDIWVF